MLRLCTGYDSKDLRSEEGKVIVRVGYWSSIKDLGFNFFFNSIPSFNKLWNFDCWNSKETVRNSKNQKEET